MNLLLSLLGLFTLTSCGSLNKVAVSSSSSMLYQAAANIETSKNFKNFEASVVPNLQLIEGLLSIDPKNKELLATLTKGYAGLAFVVNETKYLEDYLLDIDDSKHLVEMRENYSFAINYGLRYLSAKGIEYSDLVKAIRSQSSVEKLLDKKLSREHVDVELVVFLAQSIGSMINFDRTNLVLVSQLPIVKSMFDWACAIEPEINHGGCDLFYGAYYAGRPKMLGGDPSKGREYFKKMINNRPNNWLARVAFIQYYLIPLSDENGYKNEVYYLETARRDFEKNSIWGPFKKRKEAFSNEHLNIYQMMAIKRFEIIKKHEKEIF